MFGDPCPDPRNSLVILPFVWTYLFEDVDDYKSRGTYNGGKRFEKAVIMAYTYAHCVEQPGARIFWAIAAGKGMIFIGADAGNTFA